MNMKINTKMNTYTFLLLYMFIFNNNVLDMFIVHST
jgi:hypothetical protein